MTVSGSTRAVAAVDPADLCEAAAQSAARASDVPIEVLQAIARVETGRADGTGRVRPWPWAINVAGQGQWLESRDAALRHARTAQGTGIRNIDLGCFQINYHWHGDAFASLDTMIDPETNAAYAARLLAGLYSRHGSWSAAAAAYHSSTPVHAERYQARFDAALRQVRAHPPDPDVPTRRRNATLPLAAIGGGPGSLFASAATPIAPAPGAIALETMR